MAPEHSSARTTMLLVASGIVDWLLIIGAGVGGYYLGDITPNKRPFQLEDPNISFPYTVHETVSSRNLVIATVAVPVVVIILISLTVVPGLTVPPGTPAKLVWRRKLWELYASVLSFALGMASQWFIVNGLKNVCGKPRPDLLSRCQPDLENLSQYIVGGIANTTSNGQLVSASICTNTDATILDDGFRSYPSGHSASSAAGLGYLALYLAYKFGVVFPYATPTAYGEADGFSAFPSRTASSQARSDDTYELTDRRRQQETAKEYPTPSRTGRAMPLRRSGAAPPLYLLTLVLVPFGGSLFIAASRWFNFRHHGFDILFGYFIGTVTGLVAFRMYQLPMSQGAGWAWGPRSSEKAFWAGVGSQSWAYSRQRLLRTGDEEEARGAPENSGNYRSTTPTDQSVASRRVAAGTTNADPEWMSPEYRRT